MADNLALSAGNCHTAPDDWQPALHNDVKSSTMNLETQAPRGP